MRAGSRRIGAFGQAVLAVVAIVAVVALPQVASSSGGAVQRSACNISGQEQKLGTSYVTSVIARNVGCGKALKLVKAYHGCRKDKGVPDGRCNGVDGYSCSEKRESAPSQYSAKAKCSKGSKKVIQTYTQNT